MYLSIQKDLEKLRTDGYEAYILGDFNGHVGSGEGGIGGNLPNINFNDRLLQDFVSVNTLKVVNADPKLTSGLFTRSAGGFGILDSNRLCAGHRGSTKKDT